MTSGWATLRRLLGGIRTGIDFTARGS